MVQKCAKRVICNVICTQINVNMRNEVSRKDFFKENEIIYTHEPNIAEVWNILYV